MQPPLHFISPASHNQHGFYLHGWLVDCSRGVEVGQLAWKGSWSSVPTQNWSLRRKNPQGGQGRAEKPQEPCPRAWAPLTAHAPSHLDSNDWSCASERSPWSWSWSDTSPWFKELGKCLSNLNNVPTDSCCSILLISVFLEFAFLLYLLAVCLCVWLAGHTALPSLQWAPLMLAGRLTGIDKWRDGQRVKDKA